MPTCTRALRLALARGQRGHRPRWRSCVRFAAYWLKARARVCLVLLVWVGMECRYVKPPIFTLCVGNAWGEAALLLSAGSKGNRSALPSSTIMLKQVRSRNVQAFCCKLFLVDDMSSEILYPCRPSLCLASIAGKLPIARPIARHCLCMDSVLKLMGWVDIWLSCGDGMCGRMVPAAHCEVPWASDGHQHHAQGDPQRQRRAGKGAQKVAPALARVCSAH